MDDIDIGLVPDYHTLQDNNGVPHTYQMNDDDISLEDFISSILDEFIDFHQMNLDDLMLLKMILDRKIKMERDRIIEEQRLAEEERIHRQWLSHNASATMYRSVPYL